jgi:hypothetical protein
VTDKFERSTEGLRDALMSEMEDIRAGIAAAPEAMAFAALAGRVIETLEVDIKEQIRRDNLEREAREYIAEKRRLVVERTKEKRLLLEASKEVLEVATSEDGVLEDV